MDDPVSVGIMAGRTICPKSRISDSNSDFAYTTFMEECNSSNRVKHQTSTSDPELNHNEFSYPDLDFDSNLIDVSKSGALEARMPTV